jgi:hypothetical protein
MTFAERGAPVGLAALVAALVILGAGACHRTLGIGDLVYRPADGSPSADAAPATTSPRDAALDGSGGAPPDAHVAPGGEACSGDLSSDGHNCGACGHDCLGGACQMGACRPVKLADAFDPLAIMVDHKYVYWGDSREHTVIRLPKDGSGMADVVWTGQLPVIDLAADDRTIFLVASGPVHLAGQLARVEKDGSSPTELATGPVRMVVVAPGLFLYSAWEGRVVLERRLKSGNGPVPLFEDRSDAGFPIDALGGIALDERFVYATVPDGQVLRISNDQSDPPQVVAQSGFRAGPIAVDDVHMYWADRTQVYRQRKDGSGSLVVLDQGPAAARIALDDGYLYWTAPGFDLAAGAGTVRRARKDGSGGGAEVLATGLTEPRAIAVDDQAIYFTSVGDRAVYRLAK